MKYKITTGPKAFSFHDQSTGITIARGEVKELTPSQFNKPRIQRALITGHLRQVMESKEPARYTKADIKKLDKKLHDLFNGGVEAVKAAKNFTLDEAKLIAELNNLQPEADDTVVTLVEAIYETYGSKDEGAE